MGVSKQNLHYRLFAIAAPIVVQNLVFYIQLQVDMAMLGNSNPQYLAAVGNVLYPYNIMVSFLTALSAGATVLISHSFGGGALRSAKRIAEVSFFYNVLFSLPFFLTLIFFSDVLMGWMGTSEHINLLATQYMKPLAFSIIFLGVELSFVSTLQGVGKTRPIMIAGITRTLVNIFFDYVLIFGHWGFPEMGIKGAAYATSIANFTGMVYLFLAYVFTKRLPFKPNFKRVFRPTWRIQVRNIVVGLPHGLEALFWTLGQIFIVRMVNEINDMAAGIYVLISRIQALTFFFYLGIASATMVIVGQELGAKRTQNASRISYLSFRYSLAICVVASASFVIFPEHILSIFTNDKGVITGSIPLLYIISISIFPVTVNVIFGNAIRGFKDTKWMFYTQSFGTFFVICASALLLFFFKLDLRGVFIAILFDELIRSALNYNHFRGLLKSHKIPKSRA